MGQAKFSLFNFFGRFLLFIFFALCSIFYHAKLITEIEAGQSLPKQQQRDIYFVAEAVN